MGGAAGIVGSVVSTGLGMMAQKREIDAANEAAEYNAQVYEQTAAYNAQVYDQTAAFNKAGYERQAESARARGAFDLSLLARAQDQQYGRMQQGIANSGVDMSSRSAVRMLAEQRGLDERARQARKYNTELEAHGYLQESAMNEYELKTRSAMEKYDLQTKAAMSRAQKRSPWGAMLGTAIDGIGAVSGQYGKYRMLTSGGSSAYSLGGAFGFP